MRIDLRDIEKKFNYQTIFTGVNEEIQTAQKWVILGNNGSGKSTLLKIIATLALPTTGRITHKLNESFIDKDKLHKYYSICAPYIDLFAHFSAEQMVKQHLTFKPAFNGVNYKDILNLATLSDQGDKKIGQFSSGMQQRLKLALAITSDCSLLLLDEPLMNLDENGVAIYKQLLEKFAAQKTVVVCSNRQFDEYFFCSHQLDIMEFKH